MLPADPIEPINVEPPGGQVGRVGMVARRVRALASLNKSNI